MMMVWCVMMSRLEPGQPYDLQYIGTTEESATAWAHGLMNAITTHGDSHAAPSWEALPQRGYWLNVGLRYILRISEVQCDLQRSEQPGDPEELRAEILKRMEVA